MATTDTALNPPALPPFVDAAEGRLMMALKFYELGRLSLGQAAELAACTKRGFIDLLARYGIPAVDYPPEELATETAW